MQLGILSLYGIFWTRSTVQFKSVSVRPIMAKLSEIWWRQRVLPGSIQEAQAG